MSDVNKALFVLKNEATSNVVKAAEILVANGAADWIPDPLVEGTVGLLKIGTNEALIVVYTDDDDFELSEEFEEVIDDLV